MVSSCDAVLRDAALAGVLCDEPGVVVVRHALGPRRDDGLRRTVLDAGGVVEDARLRLDRSCLGCALREDALPAVVAAAASGRWRRVVLALPVTAEPVAAVQALTSGAVGGRPVSAWAHVDGVVAVAHGPALEEDLFGDDLWVERGQGLDEADARSVGETVARQLEEADAVLLGGAPSAAGAAAVRHLAGPRTEQLPLHETSGLEVLRRRRPAAAGGARSAGLLGLQHPGAQDEHGVWTTLLDSPLPLHPERLLERTAELGGSPLRARGSFWLPTRPTTACAWDAGGGQLAVGRLGAWGDGDRRTRLLVTGRGDGGAARVERAFAEALATPAEMARGGWPGAEEDGFSAWLGEVRPETGSTGAPDGGRGRTT
ncbi:GTP-binding protein [Pseudokineococcus sp. 5B2Z-1]|uniref:GTP-binding protein n=1 Tax=Pseudokineococcus sp. 5B2Z-1 TaxID=3132744 RepID=UPI0030A0E52E